MLKKDDFRYKAEIYYDIGLISRISLDVQNKF